MRQTHIRLTISELLDQAVLDVQNRGFTTTEAYKQVAEFFGIAVSKVRWFILYGDTDDADLKRRFYDRYLDHLEAQQADYVRRLDAVRQRMKEVMAQ